MSLPLATALSGHEMVTALWTDAVTLPPSRNLYLLLAAGALLVALRYVKQALDLVGTLVQGVAAATVIVCALGASLVLVALAALSGH